MARPKVFLDSSVIIASLLSITGGSFHIVNFLKDNFYFQINEYSLNEMQRVLKDKFSNQPDLLSQLFLSIGSATITILPNPTKQEVKRAAKYISKIDAPILASALKHSDYLITLDREFLKQEIIQFAKKKSLVLTTPKEFIVTNQNGNSDSL